MKDTKKLNQVMSNPCSYLHKKKLSKREKHKLDTKKTWKFNAQNVRDFAFASSRKFIWDAMNVKIGNNNVLAMSMYPKEGNPLWEKILNQNCGTHHKNLLKLLH